MSVIEEIPRRRDNLDLVQVARWVLVAVILAGTLLVVWTTPRSTSIDQLSTDLQAGRVSWIEVDCWPSGDGLVGFSVIPDTFSDGPGRDVCWSTTGGRRYAADADGLHDAVRDQLRVQYGRRAATPGEPLETTLRQSAADLSPDDHVDFGRGSTGTGDVRHWVIGIVGVCVLGLIASMVAGAQPRRGTRWGWFWLMTALGGLGTVWYLVREAPWNPAARAMPEPLAHQTTVPTPDGGTRDRFSGVRGFVLNLLLGFGVSLIVGLLPWGDDDHGGDPAVQWSVVGPGGAVTTFHQYNP